jgi:hypothetical protein
MSRYWSRLAILCLQTSHAAEMLYTGLEIRAMCSSYPASAPPLQRPPLSFAIYCYLPMAFSLDFAALCWRYILFYCMALRRFLDLDLLALNLGMR